MTFGNFAFRIGRRIGNHPIAGWLFCLTERLLPLKRMAREDGLVAFHHPRPIADPHVLIVPIRPFSALTTGQLSDSEKSQLIWRMAQLAQRISVQLQPASTWQLVINGGTRQDVGQLHGHLFHIDNDSNYELKALNDPATDLTIWVSIFRELGEADQIPENGYSLIFQWGCQMTLEAAVTQSKAT